MHEVFYTSTYSHLLLSDHCLHAQSSTPCWQLLSTPPCPIISPEHYRTHQRHLVEHVTWLSGGWPPLWYATCVACGIMLPARAQVPVRMPTWMTLKSHGIALDAVPQNYSMTAFNLFGIDGDLTADFSNISVSSDAKNFRPLHCSSPTWASQQDKQRNRSLCLLNVNF